MRALLNVLGFSLWGLIAITLSVALGALGYRASLQYRDSHLTGVRAPDRAVAPKDAAAGTSATSISPVGASSASTSSGTSPPPRPAPGQAGQRAVRQTADTTRTLFHRAAADQRYAEAVGYGEELFEDGAATPNELELIGHYYYVQRDCRNALTWIDRSIIASRAVGEVPRQALYQQKTECESNIANAAGAPATTAAVLADLIHSANRPQRTANNSKQQQISRSIAKEMTAAQRALQAQQWSEALENLDAAEKKANDPATMPPLTAFDKKTIYQFKAFADVKLGKLKDAQTEFERALATGAVTPEEKTRYTRALFAIAASTNQYQKTIDYGKEMVEAGTSKPDDQAIIAQSYYQLKDCKSSVAWADKAIAATRKAGETPKENLYLFKLQCASDAGDSPAMAAVLADLIKLTNKSQYWNNLLRIERQDERDDRNTLMIYRIMYNTNSMNADTDYIEMAQLLADGGLPGEAEAVLERALSGGVIKDEHKERTTRLLNSLKTRADSDEKGLAQTGAEAAKSSSGELDVKLGEVYYGFGDYLKAVDAITEGIKKGGIRHLDEAYVYLGLAQMQLQSYADAKKVFVSLKTLPNISPRVLRVWELYADRLGS